LERGEKKVGFKLGFTSKAKMEQMGVHSIIWGRLTDQMKIVSSGFLRREKFIHPRVEPEIAFRISQDIDRELTWEEVPACIDAVAAALEVIDSRYENFKFSLEDVVADNCSSSAFVIGNWHKAETSIRGLGISLRINGEEVQTGNSNAILGNPLESLVEISKMMVLYGEVIRQGDIVLAGAATSAVHIHKGDKIEGVFEQLGSVKFDVV
jgi:2-oxo-3-hexenedioate decarboxylase